MKIKVAFIDDLLVCNNLELLHLVNQTVLLNECEQKLIKGYDSHSAVCIKIFEDYFMGDAEVYNFAVKNGSALGDAAAVVEALNLCDRIGVDLINFSVGTTDHLDGMIIKKAIEKITQKGIVVCGAVSNKGVYTFPGSLNNVIGVKHNIRCIGGKSKKNQYSNVGVNVEVCSPMKVCGKGAMKISLNPSNSYATPLVTAQLANALALGHHVTIDNYYNYIV